jgi:hypothetical protein
MREDEGRMIVRPEQPETRNLPDVEPELQWLEDGINYLFKLSFALLAKICELTLTAAVQLYAVCREKRS